MYYIVSLIKKESDTSTAEVILVNESKIVVSSDNKLLKSFIEQIVSEPKTILAPGRVTDREATDCLYEVQPDTIEMFYALQDILSWRGLLCAFKAEEHPGGMLSGDLLQKAVTGSTEGIRVNEDGERIVEKVPQGYVAVSKTGKVIAGGHFLNANIDKEGADWQLIENSYENTPEDERQNLHVSTMAKSSHHPGLYPALYSKGTLQLPPPLVSRYKNMGNTLQEHFDSKTASDPVASAKSPEPVSVQEEKPKPEALENGELKPGKIIYSPSRGIAMDTKFWDSKQYADGKSDWSIFAYPKPIYDSHGQNPEKLKKSLEIMLAATKSPAMIYGVSDGPVSAPQGLNVKGGYLYTPLPKKEDAGVTVGKDITINNPPETRFQLADLDSPEYISQIDTSTVDTRKIRARMHLKDETGMDYVDPSFENEPVDDLDGEHARFFGESRYYQTAIIQSLVDLKQYEYYGGAPGVHGTFLNVEQGSGKNVMVIGAEGVLRNRGIIKEGTQTSFAIVPSKTVHSMANKIYQFRKKPCAVIDGIEPGKSSPSKEHRIKQWETLIKQAQEGTLPHFVVIGASKFRSSTDEDGSDVDSIDLQFMQLLTSGGAYKNKAVTGNHVGLAVVDESAHYLNPNSTRTKLMHAFVERLYASKSLVWTLNGDITSNSASDVLMEMSLINKAARDNVIALENHYMQADPARPLSEQRIWAPGGLYKFMRKFGNQIISLSGRAISREKYGLKTLEDTSVGLGAEWAGLYKDAVTTLNQIYDPGANGRDKRILGLLNVLVNISYGVLNPARAFEYDISTKKILAQTSKNMTDSDKLQLYKQVDEYILTTTELKNGKHVPKAGMDSIQRDKLYESIVSDRFRGYIDDVMSQWDNPVLESIEDSLVSAIRQSSSKVSKHGVAGISKRAIRQLHKRLSKRLAGTNVDVLRFDGDTPSPVIAEQEKQHQNPRRSTVSLVTSAAGYGLSLPCEGVSYRFPGWNPAKGNQLIKRFHRNPEDSATVGVVVPTGICAYMRDVENNKRDIMDETAAGAISSEVKDNNEEDEFEGMSSEGMSKLIEKITSGRYTPRVHNYDE